MKCTINWRPLKTLCGGLGLFIFLLALVSRAQAQETVTLQLRWHHQFEFAGYYAALEKGYYRDAGLDVKILEGGPNIRVADRVKEGLADFGVGASSALISRDRGDKIVVLAVIFQHSPAVILVTGKSGINNLKELQNRRLMDAPDRDGIVAMLKSKGVDYAKIPRVRHNGDPLDLVNGKADAMIASIHTAYVLEQRGIPYKEFSPSSYGIDFYGDNLITSDEEIANHPQRVAAFRAATLKGWKYAFAHKGEIADLIVSRYDKSASQEALLYEAAKDEPLVQPDLVEMGYQNPARWQAIAKTFKSLDMVKTADVPPGLIYKHSAFAIPSWLMPLLLVILILLVVAFLIYIRIGLLNRRLKAEINERRAAEQALRSSESRLTKTTENAPCMLFQFMLRPDGSAYFPYASSATKTYFGIDPEDVREDASPIVNLYHPDDVPGYLAEIERAKANNDVFKYEWRFLFPDGRIIWVQASSRPEFFDNGDILWNGVLLDITERKNTEEALRASEERFKSIIDNMQGGYLRTDSAGKVQGANPGMAQILKYASPDELMGKSIGQEIFFNPSDRDALVKALKEKGEVENYEVVLKCKDGTPVVVEDNAHFLYDAAGNVTGIEGLLRDISERKQMEEVLLAARKAAEESNKSKSDFLANMSHEIRTPMNAVIGMTHLALQTELNEQQRNYLQKIDIAARNLLGIINDILDFSKIEAGKLQMEVVDFDLNEVLQNVADMFTEKAQERDVEFLFRWEPGVPALLSGDPLRIGQILINLTSNAFKFTENGEVEVSVEQIADTEDSVTLQFSVRDTGIGLTKEQQGRLFQAFSQADNSTTRKYGGTGLGLTICKRLVEMMHGRIWLESEAGVGTTFFFTTTLGKSVSSSTGNTWEVGDLAGLRVLVVDDNATSREILQSILKTFGFDTVTVPSGQMALEVLRSNEKQPFDLILMDWQMPGMDGIEAARRIRSESQLPVKPPIIMVSAYGREELMRKAAKVGVASYLIKPVGPSVLFDTIAQVFGKNGHFTATQSAAGSEEEKQKLQGLRVLLVEDNEINCEVALELLSDAGINVTVAYDGKQGVEAVRAAADTGQQYDAVLMDCQMPVLDGYEATRLLRGEVRFADLPIIAMTANAMAGDREKCLAAGMNDHVTKPIEIQKLFTTLARWTHQPIAPAIASFTGPEDISTKESTEDNELTLPGVDVALGLSRVNGNRALYRRILTKFREGQTGIVEEIRIAQQAGDSELATRLAHTLKGVAGNIGAQELFTAAADVEQSLKERPEADIEVLLAHVSSRLMPILSAIASMDDTVRVETTSSDSQSTAKLDRAVVEPLLKELEVLLQRSNTGASAVIEKLKPLLRDTDSGAVLAKMAKAIGDYDFDAASDLWPELARLLEGSNNGK
jgi:PAS domain S-box-containing protein